MLVLGLLPFAVAAVPDAGPESMEQEAAAEALQLETWLPRLDRVATLYRDAALSFACKELISWMTQTGKVQHARFDYMFEYKEGSGFRDYRTLPADRGDIGSEPVSPADLGVPYYLEQGYLWAFTFLESRRPFHQFGIAGEGRALGRPAIAITFRALPPFHPGINEWNGTAWIDRETAQFLRVEGHRPEGYGSEEMPILSSEDQTSLVQMVETEFGIERNGMRFPSRVRIDLLRPRGKAKWTRVFRVEQSYGNYEFFRVRTAEEIHEHVFPAQ